ncbi:carboxylesterase/lipase family protein [Pedobacter sp. AW31-3R]|uniref:carboxylesterase/lipase family protein n=1 Tax=Pedobacter sp. AW31-3R TaxID=3445781 RepID=UPI003FA0FD62
MMKNIYNSCFLFLLMAVLVISSPVHAQVSQPLVEGGKISGTAHQGIAIFKGIPFAAPPVAALRWKAPQPVKPWNGIRHCEQFGPSPVQSEPLPFSMWSAEFLIPKTPISEDCLYLNVWTAAKKATEKRPVLVWIYGGGFVSGGSGVPIYDGEAMAGKGVVVVSINYRVGPFGFFVHPELSKESPYKSSGNYGLMDQIAALKWVKNNIAAFGGDPEQVTIAGQSAGSMSVSYLVASPLASGLFGKAIAESGAGFSRGMLTLQQAEKEGAKIVQSMGISSLQELRNLPAEELLQKAQDLRGPIIDGYVLPDQLKNIFASHRQNPVSLLTGWNEEEGLLMGSLKNAAEYKKQLEAQYGAMAEQLLTYYPASSEQEATKSQLDLARDLMFGLPNYTWANIAADARIKGQNSGQVYLYRFARKVPGEGEYAKYGAFHTGEVPYVFDNLKFVNRPWKKEDQQLAGLMSAYWINFVKYGHPNGKNLPDWPAYDPAQKKLMWFDTSSSARAVPDQLQLDLLYSITGQ